MNLPSPKELPKDALDAALSQIVPDAILRQVIARPLEQIGEITVYSVANSAEAAELRKHPNVVTAEDDTTIRELLSGPAGPIILVPASLAHTANSLARLVPAGVYGKALLLEQKA